MKHPLYCLSVCLLLVSCSLQTGCLITAYNAQPVTAYDSISSKCALYSFSLNAFSELCNDIDGNYIISPFGVAALFTILQEGSGGKTHEELQKVLCVNSDVMSLMINDINRDSTSVSGNGPVIDVANLIALRSDYKFVNTFHQLVKSKYGAEAIRLDFNSPSASESFKHWATQHGHGSSCIDVTGDMCAVNAMYFKGVWQEDIYESETKRKCFYQYDGRNTTVDMMNDKEYYYYMINDTMQALMLPYAYDRNPGACSMYVLLPREGHTIKDVISLLRHNYIYYFSENMKRELVNIHLPRFSVETKTDIKLLMRKLGVVHMDEFDCVVNKSVSLNNAIQTAGITVDEKGTEASSITIGNFNITGRKSRVCKVHNFNANRPFIYMVVNNYTGAILFMGQYTQGQLKVNGTWQSVPYSESKEDAEPLVYEEEYDGKLLKAKHVIKTEPVIERAGRDADPNKVYDVVEQMPRFPGGELIKYISTHIVYPHEAIMKNIQGRVVVRFVVQRDGSLTDIRIVKSVDPLLDREAIRLVKKMPRWEPGRQNGKVVKVRYTLPVMFSLEGRENTFFGTRR